MSYKNQKTKFGLLEFESLTHTYTLNNIEIPSVSKIQGKGGSGSPQMMKAAEQGHILHYYLENLVKGNGVAESPIVNEEILVKKMKIIKKFYNEKLKGKTVASEKMIVGKCGKNFYAGTIDIIVKEDKCIYDLKTGKIPNNCKMPKQNEIQLELYKKGWFDTFGEEIEQIFNVYLDSAIDDYIIIPASDNYNDEIQAIIDELANGKDVQVIDRTKELSELSEKIKELQEKEKALKEEIINSIGKASIKTDYLTISYVPESLRVKTEFNNDKFKDEVIKLPKEMQVPCFKLFDSCFETIESKVDEQWKFVLKK